MRKLMPLALLLAALSSAPALADPAITVRYEDDQLRVALEGSYTGAYYRVWRATDANAPFDYLASQLALCTGDCFLTDAQAQPGQTYFYRFDLQSPSGSTVSYGPYAVTVPMVPVAARIWPNPSNGRAQIELTLPGSNRRDAALEADARVLDLQGRTVRVLHTGSLARGTTTLTWDGRDSAGATLRAGIYFVRLVTPLGSAHTRVVRFR